MQPQKLTPPEIHAILSTEFGDAISALDAAEPMPSITIVDKAQWPSIAYLMREDPRLKFNYMACHSGVDYNDAAGTLGTVQNLESLGIHGHKMAIKIKCTKAENEIPSVAEVWRTADWHEREAYDLFGIVFTGHPDLRRILCPEDWEGFPLRKDYKVQEMYHGIKVPY
ncbi:MAG: NADH-quinone oxidoreductase subunit C [Rhizobacter sp.]|nr:NADH-quinone oxidoreductase subunit C [Chlorobiales bacterium]